MLSTVYAQKVLGNDPSIKFAADVLNDHVNIWDETCTTINAWCSNEAVYKIIEDQLYDSGKLKAVPADLVEDPHGVGGITGIIECNYYIMEGDEK